MKTSLVRSLGILLALSMCPAAVAQAVLEEIVVVAQKREQRLIDVPVSVSVFDDATIERAGFRNLSDLNTFVPNVHISEDSGLLQTVTIRGVGADSRNIGFDTRVGVYLDGIYLGQSPALNQSLLEVESVEFLRGPQGTLFGKNTVAGAVNIITKKPQPEFDARFSAHRSNYDGYQVSGVINQPLMEGAAARLAVDVQKRDGYLENTLTSEAAGNRDQFAWRGQLGFELSESLSLDFAVDGLDADEVPNFGDAVTDAFGTMADTVAPGDYRTAQNRFYTEDRKVWGASVTLTQALDSGHEIKYTGAFRDTDFNTTSDVDHSAADIFTIDYTDKYEQTTAEIQLTSPTGNALSYVAGVYYFLQDGETERIAAGGMDAPFLGLPAGAATDNAGELETRGLAAYGNLSFRPAQDMEVSIGLRYSNDKKSADWNIDAGGLAPIGFATGTFDRSRSEDDWSPMASLSYFFNNDLVGYLRYSEGFKNGGYNLDFVTVDVFPDNLEFDTETVRSYEVGLKGQVWDNRLRFGLTVFHMDFSDYQVNQFQEVVGGNTAIVIGNAAEVRSRGFEADVVVKVSDYLTLSATLGLLDAEFEDFAAGGSFGMDVSGNALPFAPDTSVSFALDWERPLTGSFTGFARLDYSWQDELYTTVDNVKTDALPNGDVVQSDFVDSYWLVNARVGMIHQSSNVTVSAFARNLFDEEYRITAGRDFLGTILAMVGPRRLYGVEVSWQLGAQ